MADWRHFMTRSEVIRQFSDDVNRRLAKNADEDGARPDSADQIVLPEMNEDLLKQMADHYRLAANPRNFFNVKVDRRNEQFDQCYELMRLSFSESELNPRTRYFRAPELKPPARRKSLPVMFGRFGVRPDVSATMPPGN